MKALTVVYFSGGRLDASTVQASNEATVADAVRLSGVLERHGLALEHLDLGIYSQRVRLSDCPGDGDRIEIYRPLIIDPKAARQLRAKAARQRRT